MTEFSIIGKHCVDVGPQHKETRLGVGDDAAIVSVPHDMDMLISVDSMVEGVHFAPDVSASSLAHKLLAVNLSDLAAMGAVPKWATMTLTLPSANEIWLSEFSNALRQTANTYGVQLIGGDTTKGPLNLSINIMGLSPKGQALSRSGACVEDDVYVSHVVGDAALGLLCSRSELQLSTSQQEYLVNALERPIPRVELGQVLRGLASACIDISDGLVGDLTHICQRSQVSIELDVDLIPVSQAYDAYLANGGNLNAALNGGDDYELCFTVPKSLRDEMVILSETSEVNITRVGGVTSVAKERARQKVSLRQSGTAYIAPTSDSFQHFS